MKGIEDHASAVADPFCHARFHAIAYMLQQGVHAGSQSGTVSGDAGRQHVVGILKVRHIRLQGGDIALQIRNIRVQVHNDCAIAGQVACIVIEGADIGWGIRQVVVVAAEACGQFYEAAASQINGVVAYTTSVYLVLTILCTGPESSA